MPLDDTSAKSGDGGEEIPGYGDLTLIGRGGFGVVYRARQAHPSRDVAIKILASPSIDETALSRFQRECELTGRLTGHPNVVTVLDTGFTRSGRPYVVTEYFEHGSLKKRLDEGGPLPVADVLRIGVKIAGALAAAHEAKILHRDVKPQNILLSRFGEPALADFGIARLVDSEEVSTRGDVLTPYHVAPEVLDDQPPSPASDTYSLASTLYQLLAGEPAFKRGGNEGIAPVLRRVLLEAPPEISRDVPAQVTALIRRCMAKAPQERIGDPRAFAAALQGVQEELGYARTELSGAQALPPAGAPVPGAGAGTPPASTWPAGSFEDTGRPFEDTGGTAAHGSVTPADPGSSMTVHRPHPKHSAGKARTGSAKGRPGRVIAIGAACVAGVVAVAGAAYGVYALLPAPGQERASGRQPAVADQSTAPPSRQVSPPPASSASPPEHNSAAPTDVPRPPAKTSAKGEPPPRRNRPAGQPCIPENPADRPSQKYCVWVDTYADATGYSAPNQSNPQGTVYKGKIYVFCKVWGAEMREGGDFNHWWLKTDLDKVNPGKNATAYISAFYLARWGNDVAKDNDGNAIPNC